jgi:hypothetical protein
MTCPKCGAQNDPRTKFCLECGLRFRPATDGAPAPDHNLQTVLISAAALAVVFIAALGVYIAIGRGGDEPASSPEPDAATIAKNRTPEFTSVALLAGGPDRSKIDPRVFDIIMAGVTWSELGESVFPGSDFEVSLTTSDVQAVSIGLMSNKADPARVEALWRDLGQPDRGHALYLAPVGEGGNLEVEKWLRAKLTSLGFKLVSERSKAREQLLFTVTR